MDSKSIARAALVPGSVHTAVVLLALVVVKASQVLLVAFGGILLAILIGALAGRVRRKTGLNAKAALTPTVFLPFVVATLVAWLVVLAERLTPFLQKHMVEMPRARLLTAQVLLSVLTGIFGIIFATPLTAAAMVMTKQWYVEDLLAKAPRCAQAMAWKT